MTECTLQFARTSHINRVSLFCHCLHLSLDRPGECVVVFVIVAIDFPFDMSVAHSVVTVKVMSIEPMTYITNDTCINGDIQQC